MAKSGRRAGADRVALYEVLLATNPAIERQGATMPYTSVNGNMFSFMAADGTLGLRLSTSDREAFLKKYKTTLCEQHGAVMKEYVRVPATLLPNTRQLAKYLALSYQYARSLKPKPTMKKSPAKQRRRKGLEANADLPTPRAGRRDERECTSPERQQEGTGGSRTGTRPDRRR